jgi:predicted esterase
MRTLGLLCLILVANVANAGQLLVDQVFDRYSPLVAADEFSRRVLSPTTSDRLQRFQVEIGHHAKEQTVNLADERFDVFIPTRKPAAGYGLIVFVSPIVRWPLTYDWKKVLDRSGIIYVSAVRSGNQQNVYERRIPLALHALENVRARYPIDSERVIISGFSGGSRTAIRIAAAYADVFTGALLIGGAKVMGEEDFAPPPAPIMEQLQRRMRVVYSTGKLDMPNRRLDGRSIEALETRCVAGVFKIAEGDIGHEVPDRKTLERALKRLQQPLDEELLASQGRCAAQLAVRVDADVGAAEQAYQAGQLALAGERLGAADLAWGGLAADRLIALARLVAPGFKREGQDVAKGRPVADPDSG